MQNPFKITLHDMPHNEDIDTVIREKFAKFQAAGLDVTKFHIVLEKLSKHHQKANTVAVRLDLKISRFEDIVVTEKGLDDPASVKSAVLKVCKQGLDLAHQQKKRHRDHQHLPLSAVTAVEVEEVEEEEFQS